MKFPTGSIWHYDAAWPDCDPHHDARYAEVFVVLGQDPDDNDPDGVYIHVINDPRHPRRDGHQFSFSPGGTLWNHARRIA